MTIPKLFRGIRKTTLKKQTLGLLFAVTTALGTASCPENMTEKMTMRASLKKMTNVSLGEKTSMPDHGRNTNGIALNI